MLTYQFDREKLLQILTTKYLKIRRALAESYVQENKGVILEAKQKKQVVIKQETKGKVKQEVVKSEQIKTECKEEIELNPEDYEPKFDIIAAGFVADELPPKMI